MGWQKIGSAYNDSRFPSIFFKPEEVDFSKNFHQSGRIFQSKAKYSVPIFPFLYAFITSLVLKFSKLKFKYSFPHKNKAFYFKRKIKKYPMCSLGPKLLLMFLFTSFYKYEDVNKSALIREKDPRQREFFTIESLTRNQEMVMRNLSDQYKFLVLSKLNNIRHRSFFRFLLLMSGDVSLIPGPPWYPCAICDKGVRKGVFCTHCEMWVHQKCENMTEKDYNSLRKKDVHSYTCRKCDISKHLPFYNEDLLEDPIEETVL